MYDEHAVCVIMFIVLFIYYLVIFNVLPGYIYSLSILVCGRYDDVLVDKLIAKCGHQEKLIINILKTSEIDAKR